MLDLISIIIPVYNCEKYLSESLKSVQNQTYSNLEVIVIDDGSTDNTLNIAKEFEASDERFKIIHQKNSGVSSARNLGLKLAKGKYIGFVDGDDVCENNQFEVLYNLIKKNDAQVAISALAFEYPGKTVVPGREYFGKEILLNKQQAVLELYKGTMYSGHMVNKLFCKEVCQNVLFATDLSICEDALYCLESFLNAENFVYIGEPLYHYRIHQSSSYQQPNINKLYTSHISYERMEKLILSTFELDDDCLQYFNIAYMTNDIRLKETFIKQNKTNDDRYQSIDQLLKNKYKSTLGKINIKKSIKFAIAIYFYKIHALFLVIKNSVRRIIKK